MASPRAWANCSSSTKHGTTGSTRPSATYLWTHHLGWELRLKMDGDFQRSEVCRSQQAVFDTGDAWKAALTEKGWQDAFGTSCLRRQIS